MRARAILAVSLLAVPAAFSIPSDPSGIQTAEARSYRTSSSDVYVRGYYRKNGTYVAPYYRTRANKTKLDNYGCIDYGRCK